MHMHTLKIALVEPCGHASTWAGSPRLVIDRLEGLPPSVDACCRCRSASTTRSGSPTARSTRRGTSSVHQVPAPGGMAGLEKLIGGSRARRWTARCRCGRSTSASRSTTAGSPSSAKMHHALADGDAANALLAHVTDLPGLLAEVGTTPVAEPHPPLDPTPSKRTQVWLALRDGTRQLFTLPALVRRTIVGRRGGRATTQEGRPSTCPGRSWTRRGPPSTARSLPVATSPRARVPLEDVKTGEGRARRDAQRRRAGVSSPAPCAAGWRRAASTLGLLAGRGPGRHRSAGGAGTPRRQPGLEPVHLAGHRHRRPRGAAARDLADHGGVEDRAAHARPEHAGRLGPVHPARADERGHARLLLRRVRPHTTRRRSTSSSPTSAVPASRSRSRARACSTFQRRADPRGDRAQRHGLVVRRPAELLAPHLSRPGRRPRCRSRRASARHWKSCWPWRADLEMKKTPLKDTAVFVVKVTAGAVRAVLAIGAKRVVKIPEVDELPEGRMVDLPGPGQHLRRGRAGPDARGADRRTPACAGLHGLPELVHGDPGALEGVPRHHLRPALARSRDPVAAVPLHRVRRGRHRGDGRARRRARGRRGLLHGRRDRPARLAVAIPIGSPAWCSARRPATSGAPVASSSSSR